MNKFKRVLYFIGYPIRIFFYIMLWTIGTLIGFLETPEDYTDLRKDFLEFR